MGYKLLEIIADLLHHVGNMALYKPRVTLQLVRLRFILKIEILNIFPLLWNECPNRRDQIHRAERLLGRMMKNLKFTVNIRNPPWVVTNLGSS